jgi:hypothetical protein
MGNCTTVTIDHSVGGRFSLSVGEEFHPFRPPRPNADDEERVYEGRARIIGKKLVSEFRVTRGDSFLCQEVTSLSLDAENNLVSVDRFYSGAPPRLQKAFHHKFDRVGSKASGMGVAGDSP